MASKPFLTAKEAAAELGVSRATLYSYVSRGLIRSEATANARARLYAADDIAQLRRRKATDVPVRLDQDAVLSWGDPVLDTKITLISDHRPHYRGRNALALSAHSSLETVARLLWQVDEDLFADTAITPDMAACMEKLTAFSRPDANLDGLQRCRIILALAASADPRGFVLVPQRVAETGVNIVRLMTWAFTGSAAHKENAWLPVAPAFAAAWQLPASCIELIQQALILLADHELNPSTFAVRVVASTQATPYAAVMAGLSALEGPRHGGYARRVRAMMREINRAGDVTAAINDRLQRNDPIHGFGHPLYPDGDPRAAVLLKTLRQTTLTDSHRQARLQRYQATADHVAALTGRKANIDFALTAFADSFGLPQDAPFALFAVARSVGWIAHIQEQYAEKRLIRPRARYQGERPE